MLLRILLAIQKRPAAAARNLDWSARFPMSRETNRPCASSSTFHHIASAKRVAVVVSQASASAVLTNTLDAHPSRPLFLSGDAGEAHKRMVCMLPAYSEGLTCSKIAATGLPSLLPTLCSEASESPNPCAGSAGGEVYLWRFGDAVSTAGYTPLTDEPGKFEGALSTDTVLSVSLK